MVIYNTLYIDWQVGKPKNIKMCEILLHTMDTTTYIYVMYITYQKFIALTVLQIYQKTIQTRIKRIVLWGKFYFISNLDYTVGNAAFDGQIDTKN